MHFLRQIVQALSDCQTATAPMDKTRHHSLVLNTALDLPPPKSELILENLPLRQQLIVMRL